MMRALLANFHRRYMTDAAVRLWRRRLGRRLREIDRLREVRRANRAALRKDPPV